MSKIRVKLWRLTGTSIAVQCLKMPEELRGCGGVKRTSSYCLTSCRVPEVTETELYLWGKTYSADNRIVTHTFDTFEKCNDWINAMKEMIHEYNESVAKKELKESSVPCMILD
jgi:hypothetical protein